MGVEDDCRVGGDTPTEQYASVVLDEMLFHAAKQQLSHFDALRTDGSTALERLKYWEMAYAAACILLVCAAMEAHANYLCQRAVRTSLPNHLGLSINGWDSLQRLPPESKWLLASIILTGRQILDPGKPPFQAFCSAVRRRNDWVAHAKLRRKIVSGDRVAPSYDEFRETKELTMQNARQAIHAAKATVRAVYDAMGTTPPKWAAVGDP